MTTVLKNALSRISTTAKGTAFEERARKILQENLSMSLSRVGGKSDGGVDLLGWWWLPEIASAQTSAIDQKQVPRRRIRILVQCKAEKKKSSPKYVREMEGVLYRYISYALNRDTSSTDASKNSTHDTVAVLVSESPFTKATLLRAHSSPIPIFLIHIPPEEEEHIGSAIWNAALGGARGLLQGQIESRWERSGHLKIGWPRLWHNGKPLPVWIPDEGDEVFSMKEVDDHFESQL